MDMKYDVNRGCWLYNGKSLEEEEQEQNQVYTPQDLEELGIVDEASQLQKQGINNDSALAQIDEFMGYDSRPSGMAYEKLNAWETLKDVGMAVGTEASHIFLPKEYETQYTERTHLAETLKYMYRYGAGTIGLPKTY